MAPRQKILIVEDERGAQESYRMILKDVCDLSLAATAEEGLRLFRDHLYDLAIIDIHLPDRDGISLMKELRSLDGIVPVVMVTASKDVENAVEAMKLGALDYLVKPFNVDELKVVVEKGLQTKRLKEEVEQLRGEVQKSYRFENIIGKGPKMLELFAQIAKVLDNNSTVLITGESGTGKELVARAIHYSGARKNGPFVALHTAAISEKLLESELFGHEKGSFTDAIKTKKGMFEMAHQGTLFLDEIGEMDPGTQVKLLRVLQEREIRRVGGTETIKVDVRVIAATNKDLWSQVQAGRFREDLFYRVAVIPIALPPLRERKEDIALLVHHFVGQFKKGIPTKVENFSEDALKVLEQYDWPGNVRELQNLVERVMVVTEEKEIQPKHLPLFAALEGAKNNLAVSGNSAARSLTPCELSLNDRLALYEKELILEALKQTGFVQTSAAKILKTTRRVIKYKMNSYGIKPTE